MYLVWSHFVISMSLKKSQSECRKVSRTTSTLEKPTKADWGTILDVKCRKFQLNHWTSFNEESLSETLSILNEAVYISEAGLMTSFFEAASMKQFLWGGLNETALMSQIQWGSLKIVRKPQSGCLKAGISMWHQNEGASMKASQW